MKTKPQIPILLNLLKDVEALDKKYKIFEKNTEELIKLLEIKTGLPINTMYPPGNAYKTTWKIPYGFNGSGSTWSYSTTFAGKKDSSCLMELIFFINGRITVNLFWHDAKDRNKKSEKYENLTPRKFINLAKKIKNHLDLKL